MYEEKQTFDVLKGTIPDFSTRDINLAFTIDGETQTNIKFPNKDSGYIVEKVECEDNVTADWNNSTWSLENIENKGEAKKVKCTVKFKTSKGEPILNGADPVLGDGMIPVTIGDKGEVTKVNPESGVWYSYEEKKWANAVILNEGAEEPKEGEQIEETDIESYFVWIPKYSYRLFDMGNYTTTTGVVSKNNMAIRIKFGLENTTDNYYECATPMLTNGVQGASGKSGTCEVGDYMTHPAFLAFGGNGFWAGKFGTGYKGATNASTAKNTENDSKKVIIKPNEYLWRGNQIVNMYQISYEYKRKLESHMMKNTEWGAVAYLTQSLYGRCNTAEDGTVTCNEVTVNNNKDYLTGYSNTSTPYTDSNSVASSTTGNYSGVYDMSSNLGPYVMGVMKDSKGENPIESSTDFKFASVVIDERYYDIYEYGTSQLDYSRRILGDATGEIGPFKIQDSWNNGESSIFADQANFLYSNRPWIYRASHADHTAYGIFSFYSSEGTWDNIAFRIVLVV